MTKDTKKIVLLDTHAILHRAYHALPDFTNDKGEPTGALYGLALLLIKLIKEFSPEVIVACYDLPEATFRHKEFKEYKAGRQKVDDALIAQIERAPQFFEAFGIPVLSAPGFEADDMIGTVVEQLKKEKNLQIIVASGDMDTLQLVRGDAVVVYTLRKGIKDTILYNEQGVQERFGFAPHFLPDYKGLRGDPSDNIPGVKGIGEKTGSELIQKFGTIEKMYETLRNHEIRSTKSETNLKSKKDKPKTNSGSKASGPEETEALLPKSLTPRVLELLLASEGEALFSKMLGTIRRDAPIDFTYKDHFFAERFDLAKAEKLFQTLNFRSLVPRLKELSPNAGSLASNAEPEARLSHVKEAAASLFSTGDIHSALFRRVAIMCWLADSSLHDPTPQQIFEATHTTTLEEAEKKLLMALKKDGLLRVYEEIELPLLPILDRARARGMLIDTQSLQALAKEYHAELSRLEKTIWKLAGEEFNINSPKQLGDVIFGKLALGGKGMKKTAGGAASTKVSELEKLKGSHPIITEIMQYREYQKLLSTYIDAIPPLLDKENRLHSTLVQSGAATGRMSSNNPNLQNIPIKTELGRAIRTAFVASPGYVLAAFDYSQIDLRAAALLSGDPLFIKIFEDGEDVHTSVAAAVFNVTPDKVDKEMRRRAKVINFGILYGMGVNALRQNLGTDRKEAEQFYHAYFERFPVLRDYLESLKTLARKQGYTTTYYGRRRYYPKINSALPFVRSMEERMAMNAPIQGTSADIIKLAMTHVDAAVRNAGEENHVFPLLQVHDELIYEVKEEKLKEVAPLIIKTMEHVLAGPVPLEVHASAGKSWGNLQVL